MVKLRCFIFIIGLFILSPLISQEYFDIKTPGSKYNTKCKDCIEIFRNMPDEIQFGIRRDYESNELYFFVTNREWFEQMFKKATDGIAIDIVNKNRYDCSVEILEERTIIRGDLQRPIYLKELTSNMIPTQDNRVIIKVGKVPDKFLSEDIEFNLLILKKKYLCYYNSFVDLQTYRWDLLEMGMFLDTLTYKSRFNQTISKQEQYILSHKSLRFEIPFAKNKSSYSQEDIKPLYDSLSLTNYNVKKITIRAYSSIEGKTDRNNELQKQRAESIVTALQKFQEPEIINEVNVSENWVEFLNDITYSSYSYLSELSKKEIKEKLNDKSILNALEPYLASHRKAVVVLELQKKNKYNDISAEGLVGIFQKSLSEQNLEQAIEIQNSLFDRVINQQLPATYIDKLEIPRKSEYGSLLNKNTVFKYMINNVGVYDALLELNKLADLLPKDGHIKYNIAALKFKIWVLGEQAIEPAEFKKEINSLKVGSKN
ncbi:hypothetical protein [Carboxylicivirga marina]|uniref:OmpA-like domain-containing protein n=1 Tax=Carboxylicivirga marina TaxID=2800988 RepID=A0ABS1HK21_9BACT|nr:hypothetical protein [Carboxylicivirga marina]MBK3518028.1 hypothetical protein [Carboxylicivirga marina]